MGLKSNILFIILSWLKPTAIVNNIIALDFSQVIKNKQNNLALAT